MAGKLNNIKRMQEAKKKKKRRSNSRIKGGERWKRKGKRGMNDTEGKSWKGSVRDEAR